ncbi:MAG: 50S ribosomal protein L29 [Candidatus Coatesbacteria bacterium]|nr:50S ribosomal protein L29 [Candidatus Coatesbacteria bacterium]
MKSTELKQMTEAELESTHDELTTELMNLRFQLRMKQLSNPARIRQVRKDIARIKTILWERRHAPADEG